MKSRRKQKNFCKYKIMKQLVSIIMSSYNTGSFIKEAIESVLAQTYNKWELLIVDDCSTDDTDHIVLSIKDDRIHYIKNERNRGAAFSRNRALREARGKWIAFLDSDDLWLPTKLENQLYFMVRNHVHFSYTRYMEIDEESNLSGRCVSGPRKITKTGMFHYCWPGCLTVMYDAEIVGLIQIKDIKKNNDYAMWLLVCRKADCYLLKEDLAKYRRRRGSISNKSKIEMIKWHFKLFNEVEGYGKVISFIFTIRNIFFGIWKKVRYLKQIKVS